MKLTCNSDFSRHVYADVGPDDLRRDGREAIRRAIGHQGLRQHVSAQLFTSSLVSLFVVRVGKEVLLINSSSTLYA